MSPKTPPFLMWYDDNPKLPIANKIEEAIAAYAHRLGVQPSLILVNEAELTEFPGVEVRGVTTVGRNTIWVGQGDRPNLPAPASIPPAPTPAATKRAPATAKAPPAARRARAATK
jgi:hypothetical protein